jgi:hypothetical protein
MGIIDVLQSLLTPTLCGYAVWRWLFPGVLCPFPFELAVSFGLGLGILGQVMLLLGICHVPLAKGPIMLGLTGFLIFFMVMAMGTARGVKTGRGICLDIHGERDIIWWAGMIFIAGNMAYIFWTAMHFPISEWDVIATHAFNAKIIYYDGTLENHARFPHQNYPLQIPFLISWVVMNIGFWDDQIVKLAFPFICFFFLVGQYYFLRDYTGRRWALGGVVLLISANFFTLYAYLAYRDFTMLFFNSWPLMAMLFWRRYRLSGWLIVAGLFSGFGSFTKLEGAGYVGIHLLVLAVMLASEKNLPLRQKFFHMTRFLIPSLGIAGFYMAYKWFAFGHAIAAVPEGEIVSGFDLSRIHLEISAQTWARIPVIAQRYADNLFNSGNWNIVWFLFALSLPGLYHKRGRKEAVFLMTGICCFFAVYILAFLFTQHYMWIAKTEMAMSRIILQYFPWVTMLIIFVNAPILYEPGS